MGTKWTTNEIALLRKHYSIRGPKGLQELLPGRTAAAIENQAGSLGLYFEASHKTNTITAAAALTQEEIDNVAKQKILKFLGGGKHKGLIDVCNHLDKSPAAIQKYLTELKKEHYNISLKPEGVSLASDPLQGGKQVIDVEKYFGSSREVTFGVISDMHYGNVHSREELIKLQYEIFKREGVEIVFECGNMIDGELHLNRYELVASGIDGQVNYLVNHAPRVDGVTTYFITGDDHEGWLAHNVGINIGAHIQDSFERAGRTDWKYLGFLEADVEFKTREGGACVRLAHPGGGTAYALSYTLQKIVESLQGGEKPHVYLSGHYHKMGYWMVRNIHTFLVGCMEDQTTFMRKKHIEAHLGAYIVRMTLAPNGTILKILPEAFPYFDKKVYQVNGDYNMPGLEVVEAKKKKPAPVKTF